MEAEKKSYRMCIRGNKEIEISPESFEIISSLMALEKPPQFFMVSGIMVNQNAIIWMGPVPNERWK